MYTFFLYFVLYWVKYGCPFKSTNSGTTPASSNSGPAFLPFLYIVSATAQLTITIFLSTLLSSTGLMRHVAETHKGNKPLQCEVPGCDFVSYGDRPGKWLRRHMRAGLHGKRGKRKPLPPTDKNSLANV